MVIISTSAIDVSIQAVSPESVLHLLRIGGLAVASQAGSGAGAAAGAAAAGGDAGAGVWAYDVLYAATLRKSPSKIPSASDISPARDGFFNVMV
jgi:hypothetical protein